MAKPPIITVFTVAVAAFPKDPRLAIGHYRME